LLHKKEFLSQENEVTFLTVDGATNTIKLEKDSLAFTICQVPVIYKMDVSNQIEIQYANGSNEVLKSIVLDTETTKKIVQRTGEISLIKVHLIPDNLR
jgi:hypothetical protein